LAQILNKYILNLYSRRAWRIAKRLEPTNMGAALCSAAWRKVVENKKWLLLMLSLIV